MNKSKVIQKRLKSDYNLLVDMGYEVLGVFLQGSQNYELDYSKSDIDTKAIIIPSIDDIVLNRKPVSTTKILESTEHIDIKDIRLMFGNFKKQNINFVEILFTKYKVLNPKYMQMWYKLLEHNEEIAHYDIVTAVKCMSGMSLEKFKALEHPYPTTKDKIDKYGYDPKQLHHIIRINEFIRRYLASEEYASCLISKQKDYLIEVKKGLYSLDKAREVAKRRDDETKNIRTTFLENNSAEINQEVELLLNLILSDVIKTRFKEELQD